MSIIAIIAGVAAGLIVELISSSLLPRGTVTMGGALAACAMTASGLTAMGL